jgi:GTP-binding protein Era
MKGKDNGEADLHCGYVAIVGRPNVGKSTLLNKILGQKLSITSRRPQTTRHRIMGIKTAGAIQAVYVDTPGLHQPAVKKALNRYMNRTASAALRDVDVVVFLVDRLRWTEEDKLVLDKLSDLGCPVILAVNKVDRVEQKDLLLPHLQALSEKADFLHILPLSAKTGHNVPLLEQQIAQLLPAGVHLFDESQWTDRSARFLAAERVREKIMRQLGDELPYQMTVEIESFKQVRQVIHIHALILVERQGQKAIVIGQKGERLKRIGQEAREDLENLFDSKVMLRLWVKVKSGWSDDERALRSLGYDDG